MPTPAVSGHPGAIHYSSCTKQKQKTVSQRTDRHKETASGVRPDLLVEIWLQRLLGEDTELGVNAHILALAKRVVPLAVHCAHPDQAKH